MKISDWQNCYDIGWGDLLISEAYSHPAKMARSLVFRIIDHLLKEGWAEPGQTVIDPFGGIGTTALPSLLAGMNYVGVELEEKFVTLGRQNIEMWNSRFSNMPKFTGSAVLLQGDSRRLCEVVAEAGVLVSSPPYAGAYVTNITTGRIGDNTESPWKQTAGDNYGQNNGQLAKMPEGQPLVVGSPPFVQSDLRKGGSNLLEKNAIRRGRNPYLPGTVSNLTTDPYGNSPGQLGAMPEGQPLVVSSPPFAGNTGGRGEASRNGIDPDLFDRHQGGMVGGIGSEGNLAGLKPGAVVGSPPYEGSLFGNGAGVTPAHDTRDRIVSDYGTSSGQLGTESGETFWSAAAVILDQCRQLLPPGAPAVWVVKSFVRDGAVVDFPGQWQALCEANGFETVEVVRAWLVKDKGTQMDLEGNGHKKTVKKASFFRRIYERKYPHLSIDFETVLFTRRTA